MKRKTTARPTPDRRPTEHHSQAEPSWSLDRCKRVFREGCGGELKEKRSWGSLSRVSESRVNIARGGSSEAPTEKVRENLRQASCLHGLIDHRHHVKYESSSGDHQDELDFVAVSESTLGCPYGSIVFGAICQLSQNAVRNCNSSTAAVAGEVLRSRRRSNDNEVTPLYPQVLAVRNLQCKFISILLL